MTQRAKRAFWMVFLIAVLLINAVWYFWPEIAASWAQPGPMFDPGTPR